MKWLLAEVGSNEMDMDKMAMDEMGLDEMVIHVGIQLLSTTASIYSIFS